MVSSYDESSNTLPRTQKPGRRRNDDRPSTSAENEGYLMVCPVEQKARFTKSKRSRTRSEMRASSASYSDLPDQDAPPPPLTPRTTSAGELTHYSALPRIAEISETPASPTVSNGSYFQAPGQIQSDQALTGAQSLIFGRQASASRSHRKTHSYHNTDDLIRSQPPLQYADVPPSRLAGMRRKDPVTGGWYLDQPIEVSSEVDYDQPGPSSRVRPISLQSSGRVSFTIPSTPQKESMEADPLIVSDLHQDGEVRIELPQRNPSFRQKSVRHRLKHMSLVNFFVLADCIDYTVLTAAGLLIGVEVFLVHLMILIW